ncbi:hypothetical protein L1887_63342 [Cichorium endivia]|nr:hypothetical protein L1887_63342 [Cichorium endivia]
MRVKTSESPDGRLASDYVGRRDHNHQPHRADHLAANSGEPQTQTDHRHQPKPVHPDHDEHRRVHERHEADATQTVRVAGQPTVSRVDALSDRPHPAAATSALHLQRLRSARSGKASGRPAQHPVHGAQHEHRSARAVLRDRQEQKQHCLIDG